MRFAIAFAIALAGCNSFFDLDVTELRPDEVDTDGDHVADELDNCATVANEDQLDSDGDMRGDACDPCFQCAVCTVGPEHDEDGDHIMDGCDNCPTVPNASLANADGDDLGDACDPDSRMQRRLLFDGFGEIGSQWQATAAWRASNDAAETVEGPHPYGYRLTTGHGLITGAAHWTLEVAFDVPATANQFDAIGANLIGPDSLSAFQCEILYDDGGWNLANGIPMPITVAPGLMTMKLSSKQMQSYVCRVANVEASRLPIADKYPFGLELYATRLTRYTYVEVIEGLE
ncbi:MAG TPA: thrombospondin type 3 repeat-containing protein [Kofleriaceae bacterium]|nr:thrombospondin type 3 repeat-containing protein [Kofleriaceae bacterium]